MRPPAMRAGPSAPQRCGEEGAPEYGGRHLLWLWTCGPLRQPMSADFSQPRTSCVADVTRWSSAPHRRTPPTVRPSPDQTHHLPWPLPPYQQLCEGIHIVVVRALRKRGALIDEILDPRPFGEQPPMGPRIGQIDVAGFQHRLDRLRPRRLAALGRHGDDTTDLPSKGIDDGGPIGRVFDQNRRRLWKPTAESDDRVARFCERELPFHTIDQLGVGAFSPGHQTDHVVTAGVSLNAMSQDCAHSSSAGSSS